MSVPRGLRARRRRKRMSGKAHRAKPQPKPVRRGAWWGFLQPQPEGQGKS